MNEITEESKLKKKENEKLKTEKLPLKEDFETIATEVLKINEIDNKSNTKLTLTNDEHLSAKIDSAEASNVEIPSDAPAPRLCILNVNEKQLGFTLSGSKAKSGLFKVSTIYFLKIISVYTDFSYV